MKPFKKQLADLGFQFDEQYERTVQHSRDSGDITVSIFLDVPTSRYFLEYQNDFLNIRTDKTYHAEETPVHEVLSPFLYNITRLKGVEASND